MSEVSDVRDLASDLENWMSRLPQQLRQTPLINIAIPGSHDSFTANITKNSDIAPDAEEIVKKLSFLGPILKEVMSKWSITQKYLANDQLIRGIRYFDIRTSTKTGTDDLYIVHTLYSCPLQDCLNEVANFLNNHPKEVVILDFQHFYNFTNDTHTRLIKDIEQCFGSKILAHAGKMEDITLECMAQSGCQVIVIYRQNGIDFWPSFDFPNPWPNTTDIKILINSLNDNLNQRKTNIAFISQCVLTPDVKLILENLLSSLEEKCAVDIEADRSAWIEAQKTGLGGLNIIIADFIELSDCKYVKDVINVNQTILKFF